MEHFDKLAKDWDKNDMKQDRAKAVADKLKDFLKDKNLKSAMEFGCGTGLLSFQLKDAFNSITLMDSSKGMIEVLKEKISKEKITHFHPIHIDLLNKDFSSEAFDIIYTKMTLHHILDIPKALEKFKSLLHTGSYVCIVDLDKEDGSFHKDHPDFVGHNGFDRKELAALFKTHGLNLVYESTCFEITKEDTGKVYPLFMMVFELA